MTILQKLNFNWFNRLPVIHQTQAAECGLACLAMIANYYGHEIDMITLRRRFPVSLKGATLSDVISVTHRLGLTSRALRIELEYLPKLQCPCILHWRFDHFVVLKKAGPKNITIHDPATGMRVVPIKEVSDSFTGVVLELVPGTEFRREKEKETLSLRKLVGSVSGMKSAFLQIMILCVAIEFFGLLVPFFMQWVMDMVLVAADYSLLNLLGISFIMVAVFQNFITALRSWVTTWFSSMLSVQWTTNVCRHMLRLPLSWFENRHMGDVLSRYGSLDTIQETLTTRFISTILDGVMSVVTLLMLFIYNKTLALFVTGLSALYAVIRLVAYGPLRRATEDRIVSEARTQTSIQETVRGIQAVKTNNKQAPRLSAYMNYLIDTTNKNIAVQKLSILFGVAEGLISSIGRVVLIWLAARQVLQGNFSAGMMTAFVSFSDQFISRAGGLVNALIDFRMLRMHGERLSDIVLADPETEQDEAHLLLNREVGTVGDITLRGLRFRYAETEPWVIDGIDLTIKAGESVAIVGPSGQGKTTLAKIILGLLHPQEGSILIDGHEIIEAELQNYRERIGCVMQDDILFSGSIAENISFFDSEMDMEKVIRAAHVAQIHDDIMNMPMSYYSLVGDMGSFLSGGQLQRILLARALYREPQILVLDEATSNLDVTNEHLINAEIKKMQITRIIIAHRPETIRSADRVILLQNGSVSELSPALLFNEETELTNKSEDELYTYVYESTSL